MTEPVHVTLTDPSADRFPLRSALVVALCCVSAGVVGARVLLAEHAPSQSVQHGAAPEPAHAVAITAPVPPPASTPPASAPPPATKAPEPETAPEPEAQRTAAPTPAPTAPTIAEPSRTSASRRTFEQGQVAYLRCDGAEQADARFPCPRDRELESAVWRVLSELPQCAATDPGLGKGEARLSWSGSGPIEVRLRADEGSRLHVGAVSKCTGDRLNALRSRIGASRAVAVFRFELR